MIFPPEQILVIGHQNPDTDAAVSASVYAELVEGLRRYDSPVRAVILGELTAQARYVFEKAEWPVPPIIGSLAPRVSDVASKHVDTLRSNDRFRHAVETLIRTEHSMLPILDAEGILHSTFSNRSDLTRYLFNFDAVPILSNLMDWSDLTAIPGVTPLGIQAENPELRGTVHIALDGDGAWRDQIDPEDILICGDLGVALSLPSDSFAKRIVLITSSAPSDDAVREANDRGASILLYAHSTADFLGSLVPEVRLESLDFGTGPHVGQHDFVEDVADVVRDARHAVPVVDDDGKLVGVISHRDIDRPPRRRVILIDHFESAQAVVGLCHAEILEIIDHHRVGDIETNRPVRVDCRPVGSSATIVALSHFELDREPNKRSALLLLGGLISDTLCLRSPTTTEIDRKVADRLSRIAGKPLESFGLEVLRAGDDLHTADPADIWSRDQKSFSIRNRRFTVAQLETVALDHLRSSTLESFVELVAGHFAENPDLLLSALFVTDVLSGDSWITARESPEARGIIAECFGTQTPKPGWTLARGIVSRKKQIVPRFMRALAERT